MSGLPLCSATPDLPSNSPHADNHATAWRIGPAAGLPLSLPQARRQPNHRATAILTTKRVSEPAATLATRLTAQLAATGRLPAPGIDRQTRCPARLMVTAKHTAWLVGPAAGSPTSLPQAYRRSHWILTLRLLVLVLLRCISWRVFLGNHTEGAKRLHQLSQNTAQRAAVQLLAFDVPFWSLLGSSAAD